MAREDLEACEVPMRRVTVLTESVGALWEVAVGLREGGDDLRDKLIEKSSANILDGKEEHALRIEALIMAVEAVRRDGTAK